VLTTPDSAIPDLAWKRFTQLSVAGPKSESIAVVAVVAEPLLGQFDVGAFVSFLTILVNTNQGNPCSEVRVARKRNASGSGIFVRADRVNAHESQWDGGIFCFESSLRGNGLVGRPILAAAAFRRLGAR
jgi:hypothetical protein